MTLRFHLDENMPLAVAEGLRKRGIDISTAQETGLISASDIEHMAFALGESRVVIPRDRDFLRMDSAGAEHAGIIFWTQTQRSTGQLLSAVDLLAQTENDASMKGRVVYL